MLRTAANAELEVRLGAVAVAYGKLVTDSGEGRAASIAHDCAQAAYWTLTDGCDRAAREGTDLVQMGPAAWRTRDGQATAASRTATAGAPVLFYLRSAGTASTVPRGRWNWLGVQA